MKFVDHFSYYISPGKKLSPLEVIGGQQE